MLGTHDLESFAVHFSLRIIEITEHGLAVNVCFKIRAKKSLAFDLIEEKNTLNFKKSFSKKTRQFTLLKHFSICFKANFSVCELPQVTQ